MYSKEEAKLEIKELAQEFAEYSNKEDLNEQEIKTKFIQPLFEYLNWNFRSSDVNLEEKVSNGRVDYSFRINTVPKFFVEAKRSSANVDADEAIFQAKNYAWHKAATWAVITNFKRVVIYNALIRESTMASRLRNIYLDDLKDFDSNFEDLWLLSRESFETGTIDRIAEKECKKAKLIPVEKRLKLNKNRLEMENKKTSQTTKIEETIKRTDAEIDELVYKLYGITEEERKIIEDSLKQ